MGLDLVPVIESDQGPKLGVVPGLGTGLGTGMGLVRRRFFAERQHFGTRDYKIMSFALKIRCVG